MSQNDFNLDNASGAAFRSDVNSALQALASLSSGATAPSTTYAFQFWYDTTTSLLKMRNAANSAWVTLGPWGDSTKWEIYTNNTRRFDIDVNGVATFSTTQGLKIPTGTTAQRPSGVNGYIRYNTSLSQFEGYSGGAWGAIGGAGNAVLDVFSGNGSTTAFTLSFDPGSANNTFVTVSGVVQAKATYSVSGTTLTFGTAPPSGTGNIEVVYNTTLSVGTPADNTVTAAKIVDGTLTFAKLSSGAVATQSDMESQTANKLASASLLKHHPGVAKAWVNFNGTGTVAIRAGYNVASITDNGTGNYTVTFSTAMSDANYVVIPVYVVSGSGSAIGWSAKIRNQTVNGFDVFTGGDGTTSGALTDAETVMLAVFGDM